MFRCLGCNRWWRHMMTVEGCGLYGTIKEIGKETLTLCLVPKKKSVQAL